MQQAVRQQPPHATVQQRAAQVTQQPVRSPQARPEIQNSQMPTQRLNISSNRDAILGRTNQDTSVKTYMHMEIRHVVNLKLMKMHIMLEQ